MSNRGDIAFIQDIKEAIKRINAYISGMAYKEFLKDEKTQVKKIIETEKS